MAAICQRCNAMDGRATRECELVAKKLKTVLCDECAQLTAAVHKLKPAAPAAPPASAEEKSPPVTSTTQSKSAGKAEEK